MKVFSQVLAAIAVLAAGMAVGLLLAPKDVRTRTVSRPQRLETIYIVNHAAHYISNKEIRKDIPAWETAANKDFAPTWDTPQVKLRLTSSPPAGAIVAVFKQKGPVQGALAFHEVVRGVPAIVVYAGTDNYYGYSNSVSFTHELFELLADPPAGTVGNQGYPYPYYYVGGVPAAQTPGTFWLQEVADPVEKYAYRIDGVQISDFVTQAWFNDHVNGAYDFMRVLQTPYTIAAGGYACFFFTRWNCVQNFRHAGPDAAGFFKAEHRVAG